MASLKLICAVVFLVAVAAPLTAEAMDCSFVINKVSGCIPYLRGQAMNPGNLCCSGINELNSAARSTPDRQSACECLKLAAKSIQGVDFVRAGGLPNSCKVSVPYEISPNTDCKSVK